MIDFEKIINQDKKLLTESYFELQRECEKVYGKNTFILIEIGSFFEVYESDKDGKAKEISKILNISLTKKNKNLPETTEKNPALCGIPTVALDKHLEKLISEDKWNIILIKQEGQTPNIIRKLDKIISPGTNTDFLNEEYNYLTSIYIEKNKENITYGSISLIDLSIGKILIKESFSTKDDPYYTIDEFNSIIKTNNTKEIIISSIGFEEIEILDLFNVSDKIIHLKNDLKKESNITYQNELFKKLFKIESFLSPIEDLDLERSFSSSTSLSILLTFVLEHNLNVSNLMKPAILEDNKFLYLGNNTLEQLNFPLSLKFLNKGISSIGRRYIKEQLYRPLKDIKEIQNRIDDTKLFLNIDTSKIELNLKEIYDIERLWRKFSVSKLLPFELFNFYKSLEHINNISSENLKPFLLESISDINKTFKIEKMSSLNFSNITSSFIKEGINERLDTMNKEVVILNKEILDILNKINTIIGDEEIILDDIFSLKDFDKSLFKNINLCFNESEGYFLEITNKKLENNEDKLKSIFKDIKKRTLKNSTKIFLPKIDEISNNIIILETKILSLNKEIFRDFVSFFYNKFISIEPLILFISKTEFLINNKKLIEEYKYSFPTLVENENSFLEIEELRHPIIERQEQTGIYIPNNISLGNKNDLLLDNQIIFQEKEKINGFMLYGLNSSGKTSLSKAIGFSVILAQAGFPVPAKFYRGTIFHNVLSRISGADDIEKGLSTFAIEMIELKNILNRANNKTIILGDEISHGTETISGLSIVSATVLELVEKDSFFVFATHLHQLRDIPAFDNINSVSDVHLSVFYKEDTGELIYDRKLKEGSGSSLYGLEFAKFLKLPNSFIKKAYAIRNKLANDLNEEELILSNKRSRYNKDLIVSTCSICGKKADDVHHIKEQQYAENGIIDNHDINHKFNLVNLCKEHHDMVHKNEITIFGYIKTNKGFVLDYKKN